MELVWLQGGHGEKHSQDGDRSHGCMCVHPWGQAAESPPPGTRLGADAGSRGPQCGQHLGTLEGPSWDGHRGHHSHWGQGGRKGK